LVACTFLSSAEDRLQDAVCLLRALRQEAEANNNRCAALRLGVQLAGSLLAMGEPAEASRVFNEVLTAAAAAGLYQSILDEGPEVGTLLLRTRDNARRTGEHSQLLPYIERLIAGCRELYHPDLTKTPASTVVASLSPRERNILERIGEGRSNKEIARELGIAPETVKSHIKNVFVKLAVEKRAQAVSRAQSLGLVAT
jgi:LuxR family maltose regulon positive regulatory protein